MAQPTKSLPNRPLFPVFTDKNLNTEQLVCYTYLNLVRLLPGQYRIIIIT